MRTYFRQLKCPSFHAQKVKLFYSGMIISKEKFMSEVL